MTLLRDIVIEDIMADDFQLAPGDLYLSPPAGSVSAYRTAIAALPLDPHPNVFGLHENAEITCAQTETNELCQIMLSLQPKSSSGGGKSREEEIGQVAVALQERNLGLFPLDEISRKYPLSYEQSMNTVLTQECIRYNKLLAIFNSSLAELLKALKGLVVMSSELEDMGASLYANQVPKFWSRHAYPSLKPLGAWMSDLVQRVEFIQAWVKSGTPAAFWISGFFFPQAFLTGTLQNYARKYKVAIDTVSFRFDVLDVGPTASDVGPSDGCYIHGFFLEGASWDPISKILIEAKPKELYMQFPMIWLDPQVDRPLPTSGVYSCPAYKTLTRAGTLSTTGHSTNFVLMVELPTDQPCTGTFSRYCEGFAPHWIKRAVALFCSLNY